MDRALRFHVNTPDVVHQTIDGEVVIINLATGTYYSLDATAAEIWGLLERRLALGDVIALLEGRYEANAATLERALDSFITTLTDERLLLPAPDDAGPSAADVAAPEGRRAPFGAPRLEKYTDMQDLLLVDPIHEVDDIGWPGAKTGHGTDTSGTIPPLRR